MHRKSGLIGSLNKGTWPIPIALLRLAPPNNVAYLAGKQQGCRLYFGFTEAGDGGGTGEGNGFFSEKTRYPFDRGRKGPDPSFRGAAAFAAEKRTGVRKNQITQVEQQLERPKTEEAQVKKPGEPAGIRQDAKNFRAGFTAQFQGTVGHEQMDGRVGIPNIKTGAESLKRLRVLSDRTNDQKSPAGWPISGLLDPMGDMPADAAFIVE